MAASKEVVAATAARIERIKVLFAQGLTDQEMVESEGWEIKHWQVKKLRLRAGLKRPKGGDEDYRTMDTAYVEREFTERNPKTPEEIARVIEGIARDVNRHPHTVRRHLRHQGMVPPRYEPDPALLARAEALLDDGVPYPEVIRETKLSRYVITSRFPGHSMTQPEASVYRAARKMEERLL